MSDGALSQAEIDALLGGVDSSSLGGSSGGGSAPKTNAESKALQDLLEGITPVLSSNFSMMTGVSVTVSGPKVEIFDRDGFLSKLPDTATSVKADFTAGFPGEHVYLINEDTAKKIASLMNKEDNIELDEMAMSVIGEVFSQMAGSQLTTVTDKTGNKSVATMSPQAANVPKAVVALPSGEFQAAEYQIDFGDGFKAPLWEVYSSQVASGISNALNAAKAPPPNAAPANGFTSMDMGAMQGMNMPGMNMPNMGMNMQGMNMSGMGMPGMNMQGMNMQGMGMPMMGGNPSSVQSVQFPGLSQQVTMQEQGNIGLIMDVYMEMTVELGRTRKLIKEILGMGEGTIIELDKLAGEPVDILVNHKLIAKGEVVVIDENFGVRVTEIVSPLERMNEMG